MGFEFIPSVLGILGIWFLAVTSPGADTFLIINFVLNHGKKSAFLSILGIMAGNVFWLLIGFLFIEILVDTPLFLWLKILGGGYLIFISISILKSQRDTFKSQKLNRAFMTGFLTNLSNPKMAIFVSIILSDLPKNAPNPIKVGLFFAMLFVAFVWFYFVMRLLSIKMIFDKFLKYRVYFDLLIVVFFFVFGAKLIFDALEINVY